jgi:hypothetical protein
VLIHGGVCVLRITVASVNTGNLFHVNIGKTRFRCFFSRKRRRTTLHYIKKIKTGV